MTTSERVPIVRVRGAAKSLSRDAPLLTNVDLTLFAGESLAIVGRSGSGKSTLLSLLGLLDSVDSGSYSFNGADVSAMSRRELDLVRGRNIGFVFQRFALFPHLSAVDNVKTPLQHLGGLSSSRMRGLALDQLAAVGMLHAQRRIPRRLSGGEQQRVAIARALVHSPQLILADEPTGSLDLETGRTIVHLLRGAVLARDAALVVVTHDPEVAKAMDRTLELRDGELGPFARRAPLPGL